jgi:hypothetical protein
MSPEIAQINAVRWRLGLADRRWQEAIELLRQAAAAPGYSGPALESVERVAAGIAEVRDQVKNWHLEANIRRASRPRIMSSGQRNSVKRAISELYGR